jgi:Asp-tRNA(Asn)/Glu-tRNA(Gln) amidotransferase A subunit family amidase
LQAVPLSAGELEAAGDIAGAVRGGRVSAEEVVTRALERIEERDGPVNSCVVTLGDEALAEARRIDSSPGHGGELLGVPVTVKEIFDVEGQRTTWGCPGLAARPPAARDDPHVARLRAAGAVVVARTNVPELSCWGHTDNPLYGETRNPRDRTRTAGGSSGGAAASVALGIAPIGLGSDSGGSVRIPASFCGVVGLKPSFSTLPADAAAAVSRLNCAGVLAGRVADAALALRALAPGPAAAGLPERAPALDGVRIGASADYGFAPLDPGVREGFGAALEALAAGGLPVAAASPPPLSPLPFIVPMLACEVYEAFADVLEGTDHGLSPQTLAVAGVGNRVSGRDYVRALEQRACFEAAWGTLFESVDLLLSPATQVTAFELGRFGPGEIDGVPVDPEADGSWYPTSFIANVLGAPALSVPSGLDAAGRPLALQVMGRPGADELVLAAGSEIERILPAI